MFEFQAESGRYWSSMTSALNVLKLGEWLFFKHCSLRYRNIANHSDAGEDGVAIYCALPEDKIESNDKNYKADFNSANDSLHN